MNMADSRHLSRMTQQPMQSSQQPATAPGAPFSGGTAKSFPNGRPPPPVLRQDLQQTSNRPTWPATNNGHHFAGPRAPANGQPVGGGDRMHGLTYGDMDVDMEQHGLIPPPPFNSGQGQNAMPRQMEMMDARQNGSLRPPPPLPQPHQQQMPPAGRPTGMDGQFQPNHVDIRQWHQNQYMEQDSGTGTAASTAAPTPVPYGPDCDVLIMDGNPAAGPYGDNGFPMEQMDEASAVHPASLVSNLMPYLLNETDLEIVELSLDTAYQRYAELTQEPNIVAALIDASERFNDSTGLPNLSVARKALMTLESLSRSIDGQQKFLTDWAADFLIKMLNLPPQAVGNSGIHSLAVSTVHNLIVSHEQICNMAKEILFRRGIIHVMMPLLKFGIKGMQLLVCDCLGRIAVGNPEAKSVILALHGPHEMLQIIRQSSQEQNGASTLLNYATGLLKALSTEPENKRAIIQNDGINILVECLQQNPENSRVASDILIIVRNMSDMMAADKADPHKYYALLVLVVNLLDKQSVDRISGTLRPHSQVVYAIGILANITANNDANKQTVCQLGGIEKLLALFGDLKDTTQEPAMSALPKDTVTEPVMSALRNLTTGRQGGREHTFQLVQSGGLKILAVLMKNCQSLCWMKPTLGVIKNVASLQRPEYQVAPLSSYIVSISNRVVDLLYELYPVTWIRNCGQWDLQVVCPKSKVRLHEIVGACIDALAAILRDDYSRNRLIHDNMTQRLANSAGDAFLVQIVVQALRLPMDQHVRSAAAILTLLINTDSPVRNMALDYGAFQGLNEVKHRLGQANDSLVKTVTRILYGLSEGQSPEYRSALQTQMAQQAELPNDNYNGSEYSYNGDSYHPYNTSGAASLCGSVYGSVLSVPSSDILSEYDMQPSTPAPHGGMWNQGSVPGPSHIQSAPGPSSYSQQRPQRTEMQQQAQTGQWPPQPMVHPRRPAGPHK